MLFDFFAGVNEKNFAGGAPAFAAVLATVLHCQVPF